jgi:aminopeptidase N
VSLAALALAVLAADAPGETIPSRHWDLQHLDLVLEIDPGGTVSGTATHRVAPIGRPHGWLRLHQTALDISDVSVDGQPTDKWRQSDSFVEISLPMDGAGHAVALTYTATPQTGLHFRGARGSADAAAEVWSQGESEDNRHWFPGWDHPSDTFTVSQAYTVPDSWTAFGNGATLPTTPARSGWTTHHFQLDQPIVNYLVVLAAGEYEVYTDDTARVPLVYAVPRGVGEGVARRTLDSTPAQLAWFEDLLGTPYPYAEYRQIIVQRFMYGGMENASSTILADSMLRVSDDAPWYRTENVVAHELAHQWFGDLLTCYGWRELWLNEGFATYYAWRWMEHIQGEEYAAGSHRRSQQSALGDARPMAARSWSRVGDSANASPYVRGASVLRMIEELIGRPTFDRAIRTYVAQHAHRLVESDDLRRVFEDVSGQNLGWLFDQYVFDHRIPILSTHWAWSDGTLEVTVKPEPPKGDLEPRYTFVDIEVGGPAGVMERRVWVGDGATRLLIDLEEAPRWVSMNPRGGTLASWTHTQDSAAWAAQLRESPSAFARWDAVEHLTEGDEAIAALMHVLGDSQAHITLRRQVARALGKLGDTAGLDALIALADDETPEVRRFIAESLGAARARSDVKAALLGLTRDSDPDVRARALTGLGKIYGDHAATLARLAIATPDPTPYQGIHSAAGTVLSDSGSASDIARLIPLTDARRPHGTRVAAARALVRQIEDLDEETLSGHPRASRALETFLADPNLRIRQIGVSLLARVGDETAARELVAFAAQNTVPGLSSWARDAANTIRHRSPGSEPAAPDDAQRLEERLQELADRMDQLEQWR